MLILLQKDTANVEWARDLGGLGKNQLLGLSAHLLTIYNQIFNWLSINNQLYICLIINLKPLQMTTKKRGPKPRHNGGLFDPKVYRDQYEFGEAVYRMMNTPSATLEEISGIPNDTWRTHKANYTINKLSTDKQAQLLVACKMLLISPAYYSHPMLTLKNNDNDEQ